MLFGLSDRVFPATKPEAEAASSANGGAGGSGDAAAANSQCKRPRISSA